MYPIMSIEFCLNEYYRVCILIKFIINVFNFIITFFKTQAAMCEIKTVSIVAVLLLAAAGFYTYQVNPKVGQDSEIKGESPCEKEYIKSENPCEKEYKKYCMNGGECYYLADEVIVGCNCTWLYGGKRCEKYM